MKGLTWLQDRITGTNERTRAMQSLDLIPTNLSIVRELQAGGEKAFALRVLGLTKEELAEFKYLQAEKSKPRVERILALMGEPSNFRKFLIFCYSKYDAYKAKHQNKWKSQTQEDLIKKIRSNPLKEDNDIFQLVLNSFFLYWKRHYSKEASKR